MIGERTGEEIKVEIATAFPKKTGERVMQIRGRDLLTGLPKAVTVSSHQIYHAIEETLEAVVGTVKEVLEITPPELAADIVNKGIVMTGGGALLHGLDTLISEETGLPVYVADDAISCVASGTGKALAMMNILPKPKSSKLFKKVVG
ncbi:hypothetical protein N752_30290 [Desulforamulus aquiferis]|nr:rod shape-determining protein [Desulforamulus aquiferis]RYD01288.1 hypothetical protein N752_30290 [Desulforamulus aquiferis]